MNPVNTITIIPFLVVKDALQAIDFYVGAFGGQLLEKFEMDNQKVSAQIGIGNATFWLGDEEPEYNNLSPATIGGTAVRIVLTISDPDTIFSRALEAGATQICPVTTEESWKIGKLQDPFGHIWEIGHPL